MLDLIRIFIKVVELGSFSKAAAVLNVAPSSVARNIDNLEAHLNTTLFRRSTRQLLLTEDGERFLAKSTGLLLQADELVSEMRQVKREPEGLLRISAFESFGRQCICPILPEFLSRFPHVSVELELDNRVVDLNAENTDLGIRIGQPPDSSLHARRLLPNNTMLCASPSYLKLRGTPTHPDDLAKHNCLTLGNNRQRVSWYFHNEGKRVKVNVRGNLSSRGGTPLVEAAVHGAGIVNISEWMMRGLISEGKLVQCLPDWKASTQEGSSGEIYAVYHGMKYPNPALRAFIDFLVEKLGE